MSKRDRPRGGSRWGYSIVWHSKIRCRRGAKCLVKGDGNGARRAVSGLERDVGHAGATAEQMNCMHQAQLLAPTAERKTRLGKETALDRATARSRVTAPRRESAPGARLDSETFGDAPRAIGGRHRQLQGKCAQGAQLLSEKRADVTVGPVRAYVQDEFPDEIGPGDDAAFTRQSAYKGGSKIERPHRDTPRHRDRVRNTCGNPDRAVRRRNPRTLLRAHGHDARRGVDQLVAIVRVRLDRLARRIIVREAIHPSLIKPCGLA